MEYTLSNFKGRFHAIPNIVGEFLPSDEYMVFTQIYSSCKQSLFAGKITLSQYSIQKLTGIGWRKTVKCINNLRKLNLVESYTENRKSSVFQINWKEVYLIDRFCSGITYDGLNEVRDLCINPTSITPFSELNQELLEGIQDKYQFVPKDESATISAQNAKMVADEENYKPERKSATILDKVAEMVADAKNNNQSATILNKIAEMVADEYGEDNITTTILNKVAEMVVVDTKSATISAKSVEMVADEDDYQHESATISAQNAKMVAVGCNPSSHYLSKIGQKYHLTVILSNAETLLLDAVGAEMVAVDLLKSESATISAQSATISDKICYHFEHSKYIYNIYNKNIRERSSHNIGGENKIDLSLDKSLDLNFKTILEKDVEPEEEQNFQPILKNDFIRAWFNSRDLSLPVISSSDFEQITSQPKFRDGDEDELIRYVWDQIDYPFMEESGDYKFPAYELKRIIENGWGELKLNKGDDMKLSEQEAKNIFGFDLEEQDGEIFCIINPSKLRNISYDTKKLPSYTRVRNEEDRKCRISFIDSIQEVADIDVDKLSAAEYAILLMMDYVKDRTDSNQARPDEITKLQYKGLLEEWSQKSGVPSDDLKLLWKEIPQKGKVRLSYIQLLPDKIFKYNHEHEDCTDVEELYNTKMAGED